MVPISQMNREPAVSFDSLGSSASKRARRQSALDELKLELNDDILEGEALAAHIRSEMEQADAEFLDVSSKCFGCLLFLYGLISAIYVIQMMYQVNLGCEQKYGSCMWAK